MAPAHSDFAQYCCELLASVGPCTAKRMFGGFGLSTEGMTLAIIADLGGGEKLWLKATDDNRARWEAAGCERFTYQSTKDGEAVSRGMNYYSAPEEAMDSAHAMAPWARLALEAALSAKAPKPRKSGSTRKPQPAPEAKPTRLGKARSQG
jgi:DNA transformation protein